MTFTDPNGNLRWGFTVDLNKKIWVDDTMYQKIAGNTLIIKDINAYNLLEISRNNTGIIPEKSQNISGNNTGKILEKSENNPGKVLEKPSKLVVKKPKNSQNYDANTLEYCCKTLEHLVVVDGASIKLVDNGLVLKSNPGYPAFRLKYCPNCGAVIEHDEVDKEDLDVQKPKEIQRDKPK